MSTTSHTPTASVESYLKEIGQYSLLNREEEIRLANEIQRHNHAALQTLVQSNLRLVVKIALEYTGLGLPLPDLISEGNLGLVRAAELFNPKVGAKFSTYAALWIKQRIRRAITNQAKTIRVPIWKAQLLRKTQIATEMLLSQLGHAPTDAEIAATAGLEPDDLERARSALVQVVSLDTTPGNLEDSKETNLSNTIPDENTVDPSKEIVQKELLENAMASLNTLNDKELKILSMRFGLHGHEEETLETIGKNFHVSRERIRQLQEIALTKLRRQLTDDSLIISDAERIRNFHELSDRLKVLFGDKKKPDAKILT
ncbi:MAG: RNA polymerase sigma factor RpoD/SigA [Verrucomicrobiales bacterium]|jgi:RNA polymerase primary sigma factor|nr:RNA polymerase sigma factor RpoD/SigA [Verrucomicrobiales bacterium]